MYSLVIPPELISELYLIRKKTGKSIRKQILNAITESVEKFKNLEEHTKNEFIKANVFQKTNGGEKDGTT